MREYISLVICSHVSTCTKLTWPVLKENFVKVEYDENVGQISHR